MAKAKKITLPSGQLTKIEAMKLIKSLREAMGIKGSVAKDRLPKKLKKLTGRRVSFDGELALAWIEQDVRIRDRIGKPNRPISRANIEAKIRMMDLEAFVESGQNPTIDRKGCIIDGQHTFWAIVFYFFQNESATNIDLFIKEGENPEHFQFYDLGKNRTTADVLAIDDIDNSKEIAYALRLLWIRMHGLKVSGAGKVLTD